MLRLQIVYLQYQFRFMYKIKVNASYFEENLKINKKQSNSSQCRTKFQLTQLQKQYLQTLLPKGYKFNLAGQVDQKRNRTPRKADAQFDTQFFKNEQKRDNQQVEKKADKKDDKKIKQKQSINNSSIQIPLNSGLIEEDIPINQKSKQKVRQQKNQNPFIKQLQGAKKSEKAVFQNQKQQSKASLQQNEKDAKSQKETTQKKITMTGLNNGSKQKEQDDANMEQKYNIAKEEQINRRKNDILHGIIKQVKSFQPQLTHEQKQFCQRFVSKLKAHKSSWPFRQPVDPITQGVPNYLQVVHQPMDLKTIEKKVNGNKYEHMSEFHADINKIFLNSYKFNPKETNYYTLTIELENYYYELLKQVQMHPKILEPQNVNKAIKWKVNSKNQQDFVQFEEQNINKKNKLQLSGSKSISEVVPNVVQPKQKAEIKLFRSPSIKEKNKYPQAFRKQLKTKVLKLSSEALQSIINVVFGKVQDDRQSFQLDFQKFSDEVISNIQNIVKSRIKNYEQCKSSNLQTRMLLF